MWKSLSCVRLFATPWDYTVHGILQASILEWVAVPFPREIFPNQGSNPSLPHHRQILYQLSHKEKASVKFYSWEVTRWGFEPGFSALKVFAFLLSNFTAEVTGVQVSKEASQFLGLYQLHWMSYFILNSDFFSVFSDVAMVGKTKPSTVI